MPSNRIDENPPSIWPEGSEIADLHATSPVWVVIETHFNREKRMAHELRDRDIPYYFPLIKKRDDWRRLNLLPLFPRFMFAAVPVGMDVRFDEERKRPSKYLFRTDVAHEDWKLVKELADIKSGIESGRIKSLDDLEPGQLARVIGGAFRGTEGEIERIDRRRGLAFLTTNGKQVEVAIAEVEAWGKLATVSGIVRRNPVTGEPTTVRAIKPEGIKLIPEIAGSWRDAIGAAPARKGEMSSSDAIRRGRDG